MQDGEACEVVHETDVNVAVPTVKELAFPLVVEGLVSVPFPSSERSLFELPSSEGSLFEDGHVPIWMPRSRKHGSPGILITIFGGSLSPAGGPGTTSHRASGWRPGGTIMGITVSLDDPGFVVVSHWSDVYAPLLKVSIKAASGSKVAVLVGVGTT